MLTIDHDYTVAELCRGIRGTLQVSVNTETGIMRGSSIVISQTALNNMTLSSKNHLSTVLTKTVTLALSHRCTKLVFYTIVHQVFLNETGHIDTAPCDCLKTAKQNCGYEFSENFFYQKSTIAANETYCLQN